MKRVLLVGVFLIIEITQASAQTSAYMLSPKWMIGKTSGMNFVSGTNTIIDPVDMTGNPASNPAQEATSSICGTNKSMAYYCNNYQVYNAANGLITNVNLVNGGYSSTQGCVTLPNPAITGDYYLFSGNDITGGSSNGINWYKLTKSGATFTIGAGTNIATSGQVSEGLSVSSDGAGGYWVVSHTEGPPNEYWAWQVTSAGVGAKVVSTGSSRGGSGAGGTIRFNKCQDRVALIGSQEVEVYNWNKSTGKTGAVIGFSGSGGGPGAGYSGDFSPNGQVLYFSGLNSGLLQWDLTQTYAAGVIPITGASNIAGIQLGPNNKIYLSRSSNTIAVVATPNNVGDAACGYSNAGVTVTGGGTSIGLANETWLNPQSITPVIDTVGTATCNIKNFSINFPNYFGDNIPPNTASITWAWGDASANTTANATPTHTFPTTGGPYTVTLSFKDVDNCQTWTGTKSVVITCPAPVELLNFNAARKESGVLISWQTAQELNNDYFEIQRSTDGVNFETIAKKQGAGNSNHVLSYSFFDSEVTGKQVYYKLVQHDFDGTTEASKIVVVNLDNANAIPIAVAPNPFNESFVLTKFKDEKASIVVYDIVGKVLEQRTSPESETVLVLGSTLANGTYIVEYVTSQSSYTLRVEKK